MIDGESKFVLVRGYEGGVIVPVKLVVVWAVQLVDVKVE